MEAMNWITILIAMGAAVAAVLSAWWAGHQSLSAADQARSAQQQLELAEQVRKDQAQPYIYVDIRPDRTGHIMMLVIENTGSTVARNVRVSFEPPLVSTDFPEVADLEVLRTGVPALPPGRRISWYFDTGPSIFSHDVPKRYTVTIDGEGPFGAIDQLRYEIDFTILANSEARNLGFSRERPAGWWGLGVAGSVAVRLAAIG
jgi:hypothetical protein